MSRSRRRAFVRAAVSVHSARVAAAV